jgi:superfamily II DNA or RNA helicase
LFEECGLGKSRQAIEWARVVHQHTGKNVLILTPLAVAAQFVREGAAIGVDVKHVREADEVASGISVTNYERFERFSPLEWGGVVLDESSLLKSTDGKTRSALIAECQRIPFRLACTATPAPNDHVELGNHAEFLGIMTTVEMLSMFFVHDGGETQTWRLKGHAERDFWRWVCSWAVCLTSPSDLGYSTEGYDLPALNMIEHVINVDDEMARKAGMLFAFEAKTLTDQRAARRASLSRRCEVAAQLANATDEQFLLWCDLNDESSLLKQLVPGAVEVRGSDKESHKEQAIVDFVDGKTRVLVSKPSIFGWGVNLQNCRNAAFVGLSHSFEQLYQAVRRIWRFGQAREVNAHIITSSAEGAVVANIKRKQEDFNRMVRGMSAHMADFSKSEIKAASRTFDDYVPKKTVKVPSWLKASND